MDRYEAEAIVRRRLSAIALDAGAALDYLCELIRRQESSIEALERVVHIERELRSEKAHQLHMALSDLSEKYMEIERLRSA